MKRLTLLALTLVAAAAQAQLVVGNDQSGPATIWLVDVNTGVATSLYSASDGSAKPWGMAADDANGILYWNNGGNLFSETYANLLGGTAAPTSVSLTFNGGATNFVGLGFDAATGMLIGTRNIATEAIYTIDPATGIATIGSSYDTGFDFGGLEYDNGTGVLYGLSDGTTPGRGLYSIDQGTGAGTFVAPYPAGETDIDGLAVFNGTAYYVSDGPNTAQANFYVYDIATGTQTGTLPSPFTGGGTFSGATYAAGMVPEPATMIALGAGFLALARRRRKR